ncbi:hypothetical protein EZV62_000830 [Acer yangbiense]|uniref:DUF4283 domain-containing protein n=1 Tax=Acer yangbiense TaxID=1000413 RepID=A0A5C7ISM4_9ROSI|nr:hypothetical protein EZV62_000830 [Acer yangbiense]
MSLADEDEAILEMTEESRMDGIDDVDRCLVGNVLSGKKVNREAFKGLMEQIWSPFRHVEIELVGDNIFMFYFTNKEDRNRVWQRGPWHFGNSLIALEKLNGKMVSRIVGWLKLKPGTSEEIIMVGLKYERLPDFCYACGRIGHGIKEYMDEVARKAALDGTPTKFGSWLKASTSKKKKPRFNSQGCGGSSDRSRSLDAPRNTTGDGSVSVRPESLTSHGDRIISMTVVVKSLTKEIQLETLISDRGSGPLIADDMCMDESRTGFIGPSKELAQPSIQVSVLVSSMQQVTSKSPKSSQSPKKKATRKWKRSAREGQHHQVAGIISSPLHRILDVKQSIRKTSRGKHASLLSVKNSPLPKLGPSGTMIGLSWNVRELGNPRAFAALLRLLKHHSSDLVFLSETKSNSFKVERIRVSFGFSGSLCVDSVGNNGGLLLLWKDSIKVSVLSFFLDHIDARMCREDGFLWRFTSFYGEPNASKRHVSWALLRCLKDIDNLLWVCGGDFNERLNMKDKV